ncbi:BTAD domain-containing putative transcriptional regulator [Sphaerisporangium sp. NPDC005289]|uniref:BTAD domain-containing putative transcriptional regulator n=1 Tax=Sphaerisporangium sp. NPDC005289 TaxID=3155247 RepID=UPI0033BD3BF0
MIERGLTDAESVGQRIQTLRLRAGLTQQQLASKADISLGGLRDLEQGRVSRPRANTLYRLASVLGLSPKEARDLIQLNQEHLLLTRGLHIRVLGTLSVWVDGVPVPLGSEPRRILLGMLALSPRVPVSVESLVDQVYGHRPPPKAGELVRSQVSRLRRKLQSTQFPARTGEVLVSAGGGYMLTADHNQLDHLAFERLVSRARRDRDAGRLEEAFTGYQQAIGLWRGQTLEDLPMLQIHSAVAALNRHHEMAILEYAATAGALNRHDEVLPVLYRLTEVNPLHESAHARLMVALAGSGQQAAALHVFMGLRERLAGELGLDPAPKLRDLHQAILRNELVDVGASHDVPSAPSPQTPLTARPVPTQLPTAPYGFVGRDESIAQLDALLIGDRPSTAMTSVVISGTAGVGKSALAVHWARRVVERFPDGHLYANLGGFGPEPEPVSPSDVLPGFIEALGGEPDRVAARLADLAGAYRSLLTGKRVLVVLDNARDADQVRPLLPSTPGCHIVITSRDPLLGLVVTEAAHPLELDVLTTTEARELLSMRLGADRLAAEPQATDHLIARCARLPLALAIVGAKAAISPTRSLAALVGEPADGRILNALRNDDASTDIRMVFSWSYRTLSPEAARVFVELGRRPRTEIDLEAVTAAAGESADRVRQSMDELVRAHLITEFAPRRYGMHALLHAYAGELAEQARTWT